MRHHLFLYLFFTLVVSTIYSCVPNTQTKNTEIKISYSDLEVQKILDAQDKQELKTLYSYFRHKDPAYRYLSVLAFGSIKNEAATDSLLNMLDDPIIEVRAAAAYALGQSGNTKITDRLIAAFSGKDTLEVDNIFNANILEAVGKLGNVADLKALATIKTYRSTDTLLLTGQAKSIYQMSLRNIVSDEGTSRMVDLLYLPSTSPNVKLIAANYLGRAKDINLSLFKVRLSEIFGKEGNPDISMMLATAFGKTKDLDFLPSLKAKLLSAQDYRVKCNIIRAMGGFPYLDIKETVMQELKNENIHIATTAANVILKNGIMEDVLIYQQYDNDSIPWQVRSKMNGAVLAHTALYFTKSKIAFSENIQKNLKDNSNVYAKAAYIDALSQDPFNYFLLTQLYDEQKDQIVKIACLEGLGNILRNPFFFKAFGNGFGRVKAEILNKLELAIASGDVGQIAVASGILKDETLQWKEWIPDPTFMTNALAKLTLPRDIESCNELKACISYMQGKPYEAEKPAFSHPIDWTLMKTIGDSSIAAIKTTQGLIRVKLFKNVAPATVANFVQLVNDKYYTGKIFHRVVPNFVIQTGCPRGDGYGSSDYTIRSELPQVYYEQEGYIGMASAGNHTESSQWFITHSPALHLNGNYTLFGKVVEGMDVVHKIQIGDKINEIIFVK